MLYFSLEGRNSLTVLAIKVHAEISLSVVSQDCALTSFSEITLDCEKTKCFTIDFNCPIRRLETSSPKGCFSLCGNNSASHSCSSSSGIHSTSSRLPSRDLVIFFKSYDY